MTAPRPKSLQPFATLAIVGPIGIVATLILGFFPLPHQTPDAALTGLGSVLILACLASVVVTIVGLVGIVARSRA